MKLMRKALVLALIGCLVFAAVACQNEPQPVQPTQQPSGNEGGDGGSVSKGVTPEMAANYVIRYKVTEPAIKEDEEGNFVTDENGTYVTEDKTTEYLEAGYAGVILGSTDNGETFQFLSGGSPCFTVFQQNDSRGRGYLNAHCQYIDSGSSLDQLGNETVCGYETVHYFYKSGLFRIHMYVNPDLDLTLKYSSETPQVSFEVLEVQFGVVDAEGSQYVLQDMIDKVPVDTPAPVDEVNEG